MSDKPIIGVGQVAFDGRVTENPTTFELAIEREELSIPNLGTPGGGDFAKKKRITSIGFTATVHDYSASMLARLMSGEATADVSVAVADEPLTAREGRLVPTAKVIDVLQTVTVAHNGASRADSTAYVLNDWIFEGTHLYKATTAGTSAATPPTFQTDGTDTTDGTVVWADMGVFAAVKDTDYVATGAGIRALTGKGIADGAPIKVSYTSVDAGVVELATKIADDIEVIFDGVNEQDGTVMVGQFYKVAVDGDGGIPIITEGYGGASITGSILIDSSKPIVAGKSRYGKLTIGGVAVL